MQFHDITHDTQTIYRLKAHEHAVFLLRDRGGEITFELTESGAEAHIFALFNLSRDTKIRSQIHQVHLAPHTISSFAGRSVLSGQATCDWEGSLVITKNAAQSSGHQEMHHLLLSPETRASSFPSLEIENDDVRCGHAATMSAPDPEQIFFLQSRGLSQALAISLIADGFTNTLFEKIRALGVNILK
ncbi:MAG: SufD family Fe-S cluster assembly protein [Candidatus Moranbacteria bacterium]|nr:SufD family Fe-S cluster assembly protein [Candidatus Moranbacteria bacterium]MBP9801078.1 SufD family Fe-S cluster assembly protein [Candidatus Moranbacteria bacterium]